MKDSQRKRGVTEPRLRRGSKSKGSFFSRNRRLLKSGGIFVGCILIAVFAYSRFVDSQGMNTLVEFTARATAFILNLFGVDVQASGSTVASSGFSTDIIGECTGLIPMTIFVAAVLAYPCKIKGKAIGVAVGIFGLYLLNLVRTTSLFYIGSSFPGLFETAHYLIWQSLIILVAIILWLFWARKLADAR